MSLSETGPGGGGGGGSGDGGSSLPEWLTSSSDTLKRFASNPTGFVIGIVATWIVGGFLLIGRTVAESILLAFDAAVFAFDLATDALVGGLQTVGLPVLELANDVSAFIAGLVVEAGPAAPVIAVGVLVVIAVVWYRFLKAVLLEIPVVGGLLEFLGVDL